MQKRLGTVQNFTLTVASQASAKISDNVTRVRLAVGSTGSFTGAYVLFGDSTGLTVSSTNGTLIPSPWAETFTVTPGQTLYTIAASTAVLGALSMTELP